MQTLVLTMLRKITDFARYRNIEPESALFLAIQIRLKQAKADFGNRNIYRVFHAMVGRCCAGYTRAGRNH